MPNRPPGRLTLWPPELPERIATGALHRRGYHAAMHGDGRGSGRWRHFLIAAIALAAVSACDGDDDDAVTRPVDAQAYSAAIDEFLPPAPDDGTRPVVYVAHLGGQPFPLEQQVAMIEVVEETHDLRFVDEIQAAVDGEDSEAPPRDDGLLIGVGTISTVPPHEVRVEVYTTAGRVDAHKLTLSVRNDTWRVDTIEPIDAEVLVGDE